GDCWGRSSTPRQPSATVARPAAGELNAAARRGPNKGFTEIAISSLPSPLRALIWPGQASNTQWLTRASRPDDGQPASHGAPEVASSALIAPCSALGPPRRPAASRSPGE